jgi:glycosyltransferase involved in cell wall biosynthesis
MTKIIYVWNYREWGGAQIYFLALIRELRSRQQSAVGPQPVVSVVVPEDSDARVLEYLGELGVAVEFCDPAPPTVGPERGFLKKLRHRVRVFSSENRLVTSVLRLLEETADDTYSPDTRDCCPTVLHVDLGFWQSYRALWRLCHSANVFVTQHTALVDPGGIRGAIWRWKGRQMSRRPTFVILASNNSAKNSLRPFLTAEKFDSIRVTYTGIDPNEMAAVGDDDAVQAGRPRSSRREAPLVMTVGQFIERKGCWVVLEALRKLRDAGEDVRFVWLGTSALDTAAVERISSYHLGNRFRFLSADEVGPARHDLLNLLATADIFVLASLIEGLPIALIEAMALGLPCIASRVGAIPEAIDHDVSGLLIGPGDAEALADAIRTLIHDEKTRRMFGTAARAIAFEKFDQQKTAEETVEIYNNLLENIRLGV